MKISFKQICRDYLALRGESPDLLPLLEEGEESPVLTLSDELRVLLPEAAIRATLECAPVCLDEIKEISPVPHVDDGGVRILRMPADYLRLHSLRMADWKEPVRNTEEASTLRYALGANAPAWMVCRERPMVCEYRDPGGVFLRVYGSNSNSAPLHLMYVPLPSFDGENLQISIAAYRRMLKTLCR